MTNISLDRFAAAFGISDSERKVESHEPATVSAVNEDGSYKVLFDGATELTRAVRCCDAEAGDRVLCLISNGQVFATNRIGGEDSAGGIPSGGSSGQVLAKASATDYDVEWVNQSGGGGSGHTYELDGTGTTVRLTADGSSNKGNAGTYSIPAASGSNAGTMSSAHYTKLEGIEAGADANVQSDWNATSGDALILNKPTIGAACAKGVDNSITAGSTSANLPTTAAVVAYIGSVMPTAIQSGSNLAVE